MVILTATLKIIVVTFAFLFFGILGFSGIKYKEGKTIDNEY